MQSWRAKIMQALTPKQKQTLISRAKRWTPPWTWNIALDLNSPPAVLTYIIAAEVIQSDCLVAKLVHLIVSATVYEQIVVYQAWSVIVSC